MYVIGYPKSGNTWLCFLLAYCLNSEFDDLDAPGKYPTDDYQRRYVKGGLEHTSYQSKLGQVLKTHNLQQQIPSSEPLIYVVRDGRDVMVSYYFFRRNYLKRKQHQLPRWKQLLRRLGRWQDEASFSRFLRRYVGEWQHHVQTWLARQPVAIVRYEDLKNAPVATLNQVFEQLQVAVEPEVIQQALAIFAFQQLSQRQEGDEDPNSFFRKGVVGDWENHFSTADQNFFVQQADDVMRRLGYDL